MPVGTYASKFVDMLLHSSRSPRRMKRKAVLPQFTQGEMPLPTRLLVATTFKCLASCPHCYMLQQNRRTFREQTFMEEDLFQRLMVSPFTRNLRRVMFCGGEALLHPRVFSWMDQVKERGISEVASITNGLSLQNDGIVEKLLKQDSLNKFNISLDSTTKEGYCQGRGIKNCDFEKICNQVSRIADHFGGTKTTITGSFVVKNFNAEEIDKIITFGESLGLHKVILHAFHKATGEGSGLAHSQDDSEIPAILDQIMARTDYRIEVSIQLPFVSARKMFFCPSLAGYLNIGANGFLAPCCHMPWDEKYGHFDQAKGNPINHPRIVALREQFMRGAAEKDPCLLPESCRFCNKRTKGTLSFLAKTWRKS